MTGATSHSAAMAVLRNATRYFYAPLFFFGFIGVALWAAENGCMGSTAS